MRLIDAHCHLDDPRLDPDRDTLIQRALSKHIEEFIIGGVDPAEWKRQQALAKEYPCIHNTYGIHPWTVAQGDKTTLTAMLETLDHTLQSPVAKPVALGEMGLHLGGGLDEENLENQSFYFRSQLALAKERELPVVLHIVGAHPMALQILKKDGLPARGGLIHSYSGPADCVSEYVSLGLHLSFSGSITWPRARKAPAALIATPPARLLIETDAPDQTPEPHRPGRNEPAYLLQIAEKAASLRNISLKQLASLTTANAEELFEITP